MRQTSSQTASPVETARQCYRRSSVTLWGARAMRLATPVARGTSYQRVDGVVVERQVDLMPCQGFVTTLQPVGWNVSNTLHEDGNNRKKHSQLRLLYTRVFTMYKMQKIEITILSYNRINTIDLSMPVVYRV